jgi:DNA-binding beta-propeller fold protein YncE
METMSGLLVLAQTIPLPTEGYMDRMAVDLKGQRLFLCGENESKLIIVDLRAGKVIHETKGLEGLPKKVFYLPDTNEIWVNLTDRVVIQVSGTTYEILKTIKLADYDNKLKGADNGAYDPNAHLLYVGVEMFLEGLSPEMPTPAGAKFGGRTNLQNAGASIDIVDTKTAKLVGTIPLPGGDPAGLTMDTSGKRIYVAMGDIVEGQSHVAVVDLEKRAVVAQWPIVGGPVPHAAGIDSTHHRLFVGSRMRSSTGEAGGGHQYEPGKLIVMDTDTGKVVQALDSVGGADNIFYDDATGRIYFQGTTGTVAVFQEIDPDHFKMLGKVPTGAVSKSALWVPELKKYFVAVPKHFVFTAVHGTKDIRDDLIHELTLPPEQTAPILSNLIVEEAHLMVFDYMP